MEQKIYYLTIIDCPRIVGHWSCSAVVGFSLLRGRKLLDGVNTTASRASSYHPRKLTKRMEVNSPDAISLSRSHKVEWTTLPHPNTLPPRNIILSAKEKNTSSLTRQISNYTSSLTRQMTNYLSLPNIFLIKFRNSESYMGVTITFITMNKKWRKQQHIWCRRSKNLQTKSSTLFGWFCIWSRFPRLIPSWKMTR